MVHYLNSFATTPSMRETSLILSPTRKQPFVIINLADPLVVLSFETVPSSSSPMKANASVSVLTPPPGSPIREARIEGVSLSFLIRGKSLLIPKLAGTYEGSQVDGTGEIIEALSPRNSSMTFLLRIRNPFEGRVGMLFDMLSKNAKNANLRIVGTLAAPKGEFQFF